MKKWILALLVCLAVSAGAHGQEDAFKGVFDSKETLDAARNAYPTPSEIQSVAADMYRAYVAGGPGGMMDLVNECWSAVTAPGYRGMVSYCAIVEDTGWIIENYYAKQQKREISYHFDPPTIRKRALERAHMPEDKLAPILAWVERRENLGHIFAGLTAAGFE